MDSSKTEQEKPSKDNGEHLDDSDDIYCVCIPVLIQYAALANNPVLGMSSATKTIMEALTDPDISTMGVCGKDDKHMAALLESVRRRVTRDDLFGVTVMVNLKMKPDLRIIQEEIAHQLGFSFQGQEEEEDKTASCGLRLFSSKDKKALLVAENARQLSDKIRTMPKILFIFRDLQARLDLDKLGIPFGAGADHQGCKLILTSESEEILFSYMSRLNIRIIPPKTH